MNTEIDKNKQNENEIEPNDNQPNQTTKQNDILNSSKTNYGTIKISEHVITEISRRTALGVDGVIGLKGNKTMLDAIKEFVSNKKRTNDVLVLKINGDMIEIEINAIIKYGSNVQNTAEKIQNNVSENIKKMTDMNSKVNVIISNIEKTKTKK